MKILVRLAEIAFTNLRDSGILKGEMKRFFGWVAVGSVSGKPPAVLKPNSDCGGIGVLCFAS